MELIINTNLETALPAVIDWNHEQLKKELAERLEHYNGLVVTEDAIKEAKADRAKLNKLRTAFDEKRKDVKKACLAPYEDFEKKVKEVVALIDKPIAAIDTQVKGFEEAKRQEKYAAIQSFYDESIGDLQELLPLERIIPAKWANAGEKLESITQEISETISRVRNDIGIIKAMKLAFEQNVLDTYLRTLDMSAALAEKARMEEQAERLKRLEESKAAQVAAAPVREVVAEAPAEPPRAPQEAFCAAEQTKDIDVRFYATTAAFRADMKALTIKHNIRYGRPE
jgi:hypothetical protein